mgnify:CR=1 FL=1
MAWRILIVDDHPLFRLGIAQYLQSEPGRFEVVGEAGEADEAAELARRLRPDAVVLDLYMPRRSGLEALRRIREVCPSAAVVVLTVSESDEDLLEAIRCGARGYLLKDVEPPDLADALESILKGHAVVSPAMAARLFAHCGLPAGAPDRRGDPGRGMPPAGAGQAGACAPELTPREREVLNLVGSGMTNREIARRLFISENTVKNHLRHIMEKLEVNNRVQLAMYGARKGLLRVS